MQYSVPVSSKIICSITFESRESDQLNDDSGFVNDVYSVQFPSNEVRRPRVTGEAGARQQQRRSRFGPSLVLALGRSFAGTLVAAAFFKLWQDLLGFVSPQLLKYVLGINFYVEGRGGGWGIAP